MSVVESFSSSAFSVGRDKSFWSEYDKPLHVGAIDIGTNSIHLVVASIDPESHSFSIDLAEKSTTRLGERDPVSGALTEVAIGRSIESLKHFKELAESYKVEQLVTAATSAVREAPNGKEFVEKVKNLLELDIELVSGSEEARLIYLGVLSGMPFGESPHFLLDIGGGSSELILADASDARALTSTKLGAVRLKRDFIKQEPITAQNRLFLQAFIQGSFEPAIDKVCSRIRPGEKPVMVATSGTALAIGALLASEDSSTPVKLQGYRISKNNLDRLIDRLISLKPDQRSKLTQLSERRSEIIVPGALILQKSMEMLSMDELFLSERALREGLIVDWMLRHQLFEDRFSFQGSIRKRTIIHQVHRFGVKKIRAERVASHALTFYEKTKGALHNDQGKGRELLWAAAMLHSCGQHINLASYHKHSWYLIRHGELLGYSQAEHLMIAAIARYHRRSLPKKRHEEWQLILDKNDRKIVSEMALLLRLAAAIDRRPEPVVGSIDIQVKSSEILCELCPEDCNQNLSLEEWSLSNCREIVKSVSGLDLKALQISREINKVQN